MSEIAKALVQAQSEAQAVAKSSTNSFHKYKYASAEAMIEEARGCLTKAGLALICTGWERVELRETNETKVAVSYTLYHTSGESLQFEAETTCVPEKGRPQDKAEATALTYNLGYFLRGLLLLPREEEGTAVDARDDRDRAAPRQAPAGLTVEEAVKLMSSAESLDALKNAATRCKAAGYVGNNDVKTAYQTRLAELSK